MKLREGHFITAGSIPTGHLLIGAVFGVARVNRLTERAVRKGIEKAEEDLWNDVQKLGGTAVANFRISRVNTVDEQSIVVYGDAIACD